MRNLTEKWKPLKLCFKNSVRRYSLYLSFQPRFLFLYELRAEIGAGSKRTTATNGAACERPLIKAFAAIL